MINEKTVEVERWYYELERLMWAMVHDIANTERFYLDPEEVFADLSEELVKIVLNYYGKGEEEMKPLLITSLRNRCVDLQVMEYGTYRNDGEQDLESLDAEIEQGDLEGVTLADKLGRPSTEDLFFDMDGFLEELSDDAYWLIAEVLEPSDRMRLQMELAVMRKLAVASSNCWMVKPTKLVYRRALGWTKQRLEKAWREIRETLESW